MVYKKIFRTSVCLSAVVLSLGFTHEASADPGLDLDLGDNDTAPVIEEYFSYNYGDKDDDGKEYFVGLGQKLDGSPYDNLGISVAKKYVNIRTEPNADSEIVGKLYRGSAAEIISTESGWSKVKSGDVEGYINSKYLAKGSEAKELEDDLADKYAIVDTRTLLIREGPNTKSDIVGVVSLDEKCNMESETKNWVKIAMDEKEGFVSKEYINMKIKFDDAISIEEEQTKIAEKEAKRSKEEKSNKNKKSQSKPEKKIASSSRGKTSRSKVVKEKAPEQKTTRKKPESNKVSKSNQGSSEKSAKETIAMRESGGNYNARNGKYIGRYQLTDSYLNGDHSPENQERVADNYVKNRYGSWENALKHHNQKGWY